MSADEPQTPGQLPAQVINQLLENQKNELALKAAELQYKSQEDNHAFEHAGKMLEAQERDRKDGRNHDYRGRILQCIFITSLVIAALLFLGLLAFMNKDAMAMEMIKAGVYLTAGALSGYFYGRSKASGKDGHGTAQFDDPPDTN